MREPTDSVTTRWRLAAILGTVAILGSVGVLAAVTTAGLMAPYLPPVTSPVARRGIDLLEHSALAINNDFADDLLSVPFNAEVALLPPVSGG